MTPNPTPRKVGNLAAGAGCAVCCAVPMLVITGAVSAGSLVVGGVTVASVVTVVFLAAVVATRRTSGGSVGLQLALFAAGGAGAFAGLWGAARQDPHAHLVISAAVATLAAAALVALARSEQATTGSADHPS